MILILIGAIIAIVFIPSSIVMVKEVKEYDYLPFFPPLMVVGVVGVWLAIYAAIFAPPEYGEWEVIEKVELVNLSNSTVSEGDVKDYITDTISGNIIEWEDKNCKTPELIVERRSPKWTMWSLGLSYDPQVRYVFHVPYGIISHEVNLK